MCPVLLVCHLAEAATPGLADRAERAAALLSAQPGCRWVEVGRAFERFALQGTALGVRNAHVNMPVELPGLRPQFASALGLGTARPDLVVRFGRGPTLPPSLRRPLQAVFV